MNPRLLDRMQRGVHKRLDNAHVILDPDGGAYPCDGNYRADSSDYVPDGEGGVAINSVAPVLSVYLPDLPVAPATKMVVSVALLQVDRTYAIPVRYRITDTQDDGYGGTKLLLVQGG